MRKLFESWKYLFKNLWALLPFAVLPAVFLAFTLDYTAISAFIRGLFTGQPRFEFIDYFRTFGIVRIDSVPGAIYSVFAFLFSIAGAALLLTFVEKHMRIGKRSLSGLWRGFLSILPSTIFIGCFYLALFEFWALLLSSFFSLISAIPVIAVVYVLFAVVYLLLSYGLLYVVAVFYMWLPCRQITGFGYYDALLYSYRLLGGIRWGLILSYLASFGVALLVFGLTALLPEAVFRILGIIAFVLLFLSFCVRMEIAYFRVDKLDREDLLHSYREY